MMYPKFEYDTQRPIDLICMGRVAVDLYAEQIGASLSDASSFKKYLGGCAGNIAVGTSRLGLKSMMFSCVGQDDMGVFLRRELQKEGVNTDLLYASNQHLTGLVLLGINPPKEFPLMFYRKDCADMQLKAEQVDESWLTQTKAILITGTGLSTESMFTTSLAVIQKAKRARCSVILDLDYRPVLWGLTSVGNGECRFLNSLEVTKAYQKILPSCDLIVGTEEEFCIAGGSEILSEALLAVRQLSQAPFVVKLGEKGCVVYFDSIDVPLQSKPFPVEILNVLGAGDGFMSGLLAGLLTGKSWDVATQYANASGALVVTRHGCAPAIPYLKELNYFIESYDSNPLIWQSPVLAALHDKSNSNQTIVKYPRGFSTGVNPIVHMQQSGMNFSSIKLLPDESFEFNHRLEFAALLMTGKVLFSYANQTVMAERYDYFNENPIVLHCAAGEVSHVKAITDAEILLIETENNHSFSPMLFNETNMLELDQRGKGVLDNTSHRLVRTVFDKRNRPDSNLVVGEIITFQGRWSSYPPHYHDQPEIYHYRFSEPQGFAFGENGKDVMRIEHNDTYQILEGQEHAHCTAPGYALYTLWFICHLPDNPYLTPTFRPEHEWTRTASANVRVWRPKE